MSVPRTIVAQVSFVPLDDRATEHIGFAPDSVYFECCFLPLIGPSSCLLYRHVAPLIRVADSAVIDLAELGRDLGLGPGTGPRSPIVRTLARLEAFRLGQWRHDDHYALRRAVAPLNDRQARRLPPMARAIHYRTLGRPAHRASTIDPAGAGRRGFGR